MTTAEERDRATSLIRQQWKVTRHHQHQQHHHHNSPSPTSSLSSSSPTFSCRTRNSLCSPLVFSYWLSCFTSSSSCCRRPELILTGGALMWRPPVNPRTRLKNEGWAFWEFVVQLVGSSLDVHSTLTILSSQSPLTYYYRNCFVGPRGAKLSKTMTEVSNTHIQYIYFRDKQAQNWPY